MSHKVRNIYRKILSFIEKVFWPLFSHLWRRQGEGFNIRMSTKRQTPYLTTYEGRIRASPDLIHKKLWMISSESHLGTLQQDFRTWFNFGFVLKTAYFFLELLSLHHKNTAANLLKFQASHPGSTHKTRLLSEPRSELSSSPDWSTQSPPLNEVPVGRSRTGRAPALSVFSFHSLGYLSVWNWGKWSYFYGDPSLPFSTASVPHGGIAISALPSPFPFLLESSVLRD